MRPFVHHELGQKQVLVIEGNVVRIVAEVAGREAKEFAFDVAMDSTGSGPSHVDQGKCYQLIAKRMVAHAFEGYTTCLFAYGQTGTGLSCSC